MANKQLRARLFVATDDPGVLQDALSKWGKMWEINAFDQNSQGKFKPYKYYSREQYGFNLIGSRNSYTAIQHFMKDIHILARCQFVVCTFSSNVSFYGIFLLFC
jgi:hypothetical protein